MDDDVRDALVTICEVLSQKITFDGVQPTEKQRLEETPKLTAPLKALLDKLKDA